MANRTQKAAMKQKADAAKAERSTAKAKREEELDFEAARAMAVLDAEARKGHKAATPDAKGKPGKGAKPAKGAKPGKEAKPVKAAKAKPATRKGKPRKGEPAVDPKDAARPEPAKPGFMERWRAAREERAKARRAEAERRAAQRAAEADRKAKERAAAEEKARKDAEERAAAEAAAAAASEKERKKLEKREAAKEARRQAEMAEAIKEAEAAARREERRLQRQAERAAIEERERQAAEEAEAEDRRREQAKADERAARGAAKEAAKAQRAEEAAAKAAAAAAEPEPAELEPEMEFQEGAKPVDPSRALVPTPDAKGKKGKGEAAPATPVDAQADKVAEELARRRSKPVVIVEDEEPPVPRLPNLREVASKRKGEADEAGEGGEDAEPLVTGEAVVDERYRPEAPMPAPPSGLSVPEMFFLVATDHGWDERAEKAKEGRLGGAFAGAVMLELLARGRLVVQRDRFTVVGESSEDGAVETAAARVRDIRERKGDLSSLPHMRRVAKWNRELLEPFKDRLAERGLVRHGHRMHLGLFHRSTVEVLDEDAQERLRNKLRRTIAGGGTPEASSVLVLGLLDACGLLGTIVPDEAMDYNRKRLNGLLAGRDIMGYKVDPALKALQEVAVRTILQNVRTMTHG